MNVIITVYTTPDCVQCSQTKRLLDIWKVKYHEVDASNTKIADEIKRLYNYRTSPVVLVSAEVGKITDHWSGFRLEKLKALKAQLERLATEGNQDGQA